MSKMPDTIDNMPQQNDPSTLESQVLALEEQVDQIHSVLQYLTLANYELNKDMQIIYACLNDVIASTADPYDSSGFPFDDDPDDDLIN